MPKIISRVNFIKEKTISLLVEFSKVCRLFEKLEKTSKRLEKILILRDFILENKKESKLILDMIAGNYQREIDKKSTGISLKTIFSVISFTSKKNEIEIEKLFNKVGDVGKVAEEMISTEQKQSGFNKQKLIFENITKSLETISKTSGTNKNKIKKEILTKLFIDAQSSIEYRYLARLLIDDLRIGVSEGVLKEACVNSYFPQVIGINIICPNCSYSNLNMKNCFNCSKPLKNENQEEIAVKKFKVVEIGPPKGELGLENFIGKFSNEDINNFMLRLNRDEHIIKSNEGRQIYNLFTHLFEKKYNLVNSFRKILNEIEKDLSSVMKAEIELGTPIRSMLGTRAQTIDESFNISGKPALVDFKYDGLRVQIHNNRGKVKLFSRNLDEITNQFPEVVEFIKDNFSEQTFVMDSECVGFDFKKMKFLEFQILSRRILSKNVHEVSHIKVVVKAFDLMMLDNKTLIDEPHEYRRKLLDDMFIGKELIQKCDFDIEKIKKIAKC